MSDSPINIEDIKKFYNYIKPNILTRQNFEINPENKKFENKGFVDTKINSEADFADQISSLNNNHPLFTPYRKTFGGRKDEDVIESKCIVIDIDNDEAGSKSMKFEALMGTVGIKIQAKAMSGGGFHYYIPINPIDTTRESGRKLANKTNLKLKQFLIESKVDIDEKIFNLGRIIRIWGTYNHKRKQLCKLVLFNEMSDKEIESNFNIISAFELKIVKLESSESSSQTSCYYCDYCVNNKLPKEDMGKNDITLRNAAIYYKTQKDGYDKALKLTEMQGHDQTELDGWWKKDYTEGVGCNQIMKQLREHSPELLPATCYKCRRENKNKVEYMNTHETFNILKENARVKGVFLINREHTLKGKLLPSKSIYKDTYVLMSKWKPIPKEGQTFSDKDMLITFLNEKQPSKTKYELIDNIAANMFSYEFIEENNNYLLLSEKELDYGECIIDGSLVYLSDKISIGNVGMTDIRRKVIFSHSIIPLLRKVKTHEELINIVNFEKEDLINTLWYDSEEKVSYGNPKFYNELILAFLFSSRSKYPLHLIVSGPHNSGKSTLLECLNNNVFQEYGGIADASASTGVKGLIPSFFGKVPKLGALLSCLRLVFVDEFFRTIKDFENGTDDISSMNNILEYKENHRALSGKQDIRMGMKAKCLFVTNPVFGKTFQQSIEYLPEPLLSRLLILNQHKDHIHTIKNKPQLIYDPNIIEGNIVLSMYDYCQTFKSIYNKEKVNEIVDRNKINVPDFFIELYEGRYRNHHSYLIMDGIIKTRCFFEKDLEFTAKKEDYIKFEKVWNYVIQSWDQTKLISNKEQFQMLELIGDGTTEIILKQKCEKYNIDFKENYKKLLKYKKIINERHNIKVVPEKDTSLDDFENDF